MVRSGAAARAAAAESVTTCSRSTSATCRGRAWSSRANSSRSSTSTPIRAASDSIRAIVSSSFGPGGTAPIRYSSANPRTLVRGVRSSCDASATNWRIRASDARAVSAERTAARSDSCCASNARDTASTIVLNECARLPTSVRGSGIGARWARSPAAIDGGRALDVPQRSQAAADQEPAQAAQQRQHHGPDPQLDQGQPLHRGIDPGDVLGDCDRAGRVGQRQAHRSPAGGPGLRFDDERLTVHGRHLADRLVRQLRRVGHVRAGAHRLMLGPGRVADLDVAEVVARRTRSAATAPAPQRAPAAEGVGSLGQAVVDLVEQIAPQGGHGSDPRDEQTHGDQREQEPDETGAQRDARPPALGAPGVCHQVPRGVRSTYPTPRTVCSSRGSVVSILRRR